MPRRPRLALANVPLHIIQRGNNRQACFYAEEDYRFYLDWLHKYADKTKDGKGVRLVILHKDID